MEEIWKDIEGFEGCYQISNLGRVKSLPREIKNGRGSRLSKSRFLNASLSNTGYLHLNLCYNGSYKTKKIHRLIAQSFIPNPENKPQINHKNGIKTDNRIENLEWVTGSENIIHAFDKNLSSNKGVKNSKAKLKEFQVLEIRKMRSDGISLKEISKQFKISVSTVSFIATNRSWSHI